MVPEGTRAPAGMTILEKMVRQARALRIDQCLLRVPRIRRNLRGTIRYGLYCPQRGLIKTAWPAENETAWLCRFLLSAYKGAAGQGGARLLETPPGRSRGDLEEWEDEIPRYGLFPEGGKQRRKSDIVRNKIPKTGIFAFAFYREIAIIRYR